MKIFVIIALSLLCMSTFAGGIETGLVRFDQGQYGSGPASAGVTLFYLEGGVKTQKPACATPFANGERWAIHNDWPAAKIQMSILLAAATSGKSVTVYGSGDCGVFAQTETAVNIFPYYY